MEEKNNLDNKRELISNWLLNENTLLVISQGENEEYPVVSIRYEKYGEVRSKDLIRLTPDVRIEHNERMIAMFRKTGKVIKKYQLVSVYDTTSQEFVGTSHMHLHYSACKSEGVTPTTLGTKKK